MCLSSKVVGWVEVIASVWAGVLAWQSMDKPVLILALALLVAGIFRVTEKKRK